MCDEVFDELKQRFPTEKLRELKMYNGCAQCSVTRTTAFSRWKQTASFAESMVEQYNLPTTSNIPGTPGVHLGPRKYGEVEGYDIIPQYRALVGSIVWLSVTTSLDIANSPHACSRHSHNHRTRHWMALLRVAG